MKHTIKAVVAGIAAIGAFGLASTASAGPVLGVNPNGTGAGGYTYTDLWTNFTDSALAIGFNPNLLVPPGAPYDITLLSQARVAGFQLNGLPVFPGVGLTLNKPAADGYEITKVLSIREQVISNSSPGVGLANANFGMTTQTADVDPTTPGLQQLAIYFDRLGDGSRAIPGDGAGTVKCYGAGATSTPALCGATSDGDLALSAHLVSNVSSFAAQGGTGTGSFDLRFVIDFVNPAYLDAVTGSIFGEKITGTTNFPSQFTPASMWDGTATATGILLKVDSSQSFIQRVPEPGSLTLMGLGLLGLGASVFRRRKA
jgi:hypothetical protein